MAKLVRGFRDIFEPQSNQFTELENCARGGNFIGVSGGSVYFNQVFEMCFGLGV